MNYKDRRKKANAANQKIRRAIQKITGKKLPKILEIHHKKSVKKGGSPSNVKNIQILPQKINRRRGAR